jgi:hypothetical protein
MLKRGPPMRAALAKELDFLEEDGVESDRLGERHPDDGLNEDLARRTRIPSDRFGAFHADQAHPDSRSETTQASLHVACDFRDYFNH